MLLRAPCVLLFVLTVCWLRENAAIPLASDFPVADQMLHAFEKGRINFQDNSQHAASRIRARRNAETISLHDSFVDESTSSEDEESLQDKVKIKNQNVNVNILSRHSDFNEMRRTFSSTTTMPDLRDIKVKEDRSCVSGKKKNQRYSSSFVENMKSRQFTVDKEFDEVIGNNSKAKTTSSVYVGEDITLCWIETTTIKEDKKVQPPKRLVIREYTISFENSATIPDRYLQCERLEGEVTADDPEIGKTALFEVIDEDTKASRVVNFTTVDNVGEIHVWQHKKVKCGVGPVVNKNIMEWNDDPKNPKKRLEIKISPTLRQLNAEKTEQEPCTEKAEEISTEEAEETSTEEAEETSTEEAEETSSEEAEETSTEAVEETSTEEAEETSSEEAEETSIEKAKETSTEEAKGISTEVAKETSTEEAKGISTEEAKEISTEEAKETSTQEAKETSTEEAKETSTEEAKETSSEEAKETSTEEAKETSSEEARETSTEEARETSTEEARETSTEEVKGFSIEEAKEISTEEAKETSTEEAKETSTEVIKEISTEEAKGISTEEAKETSTEEAKGISIEEAKETSTQEYRETSSEEAKETSTEEIKEISTEEAKGISTEEAKETSTEEAKGISIEEAKETSTQEYRETSSEEAKETSTEEVKGFSIEEATETSTEEAKEISTEEAKETSTEEARETSTQEARETSTEEAKEISTEEAKETSTEEIKEISTEEAKETSTEEAKGISIEEAKETSTQEARETSTEEAKGISTEEAKETSTEGAKETSTEFNVMSDSTESCESTADSSICEVTIRSDKSSTKHPNSNETEEVTVTNSSPSEEVDSDAVGNDEVGSGENDSEEAPILPTDHETSTLSYETTISSTTKASIFQKTDEPALQEKECKENSSDPECATRGSDTFSEDNLSTESSTVNVKLSEGLSAEFSSGSSEEDVTSTIPAWVTEQTTPAVSETGVPTLKEFRTEVDNFRSLDQTKEFGTPTSAETVESGTFEEDNDRSLASMEVNTMTLSETSSEQMITSTLPSLGLKKPTGEVLEFGNITKSLESSLTSESATEKLSLEESKETVTIRTIDRARTVEPEVVSKIELTPLISTTSSPKYPPIVLLPASSEEVDYTCENSEDCATASSSMSCDEAGNCHTTSRPCESGECSEEEIDYSESEVIPSADMRTIEIANTTMIALTSQETENGSTETNSVFTTLEARRSTPLSSTTKPRHKFTLRVKILLEHVNNKNEKQNLVEVEKKLLLNENPEYPHQVANELLKQLKSLNDSVNMETMDALLNCTSLGKLTKNAVFIKMEPGNTVDDNYEGSELAEDSTAEISSSHEYTQYESIEYPESTENVEFVHKRRRQRRSLDGNLIMAAETNKLNISEQIRPDLNDSLTSDSNRSASTSRHEQEDKRFETSPSTKKNVQIFATMRGSEEETIDPMYVENERNVTRGKNKSEEITKMKIKIIKQTLPGIKEDVSTGLQHMISELMHGLTLVKNGRELAKVNLIGILINPNDRRILLRRRREATEEVGRWSNERIKKTSTLGGDLRSFTEFTLYKILS